MNRLGPVERNHYLLRKMINILNTYLKLHVYGLEKISIISKNA